MAGPSIAGTNVTLSYVPKRRSLESWSIAFPDGQSIGPIKRPEDAGEGVSISPIEVIQPHIFKDCPICGAPATSREHVPPESIGGKVMTRTCEPCNHRLASQVEADLADWMDSAIRVPRFRSAAVAGSRKVSRIVIRTAPGGEVILLPQGRVDQGIIDMLRSGALSLAGVLPEPRRYRLALLKHAYLAACLKFPSLVDNEIAAQVRHDLIAARDADGRDNVPASALAMGLTVLRRNEAATVPPVVLAIAHLTDGPCEGVLLAGRVFVSWTSTLTEQPAGTPRQVNLRLAVGGEIRGAITE